MSKKQLNGQFNGKKHLTKHTNLITMNGKEVVNNNDGILQDDKGGVIAGQKTIFERADEEDSSEDLEQEVILIEDYGQGQNVS